jgi:hypothetical protein
MKKELKGFIAGILTTACMSYAVGSNAIQKVSADLYSNVNVYLNGKQVQTDNSSASKMNALKYKGDVYIPIKALEGYTGSTAAWDGKNKRILINQKSSIGIQTVTVSTAEQFVNAIASNTRIIMKPGVYDLSKIKQIDSKDRTVIWNKVEDGTEIRITPRYANILFFDNVNGSAGNSTASTF